MEVRSESDDQLCGFVVQRGERWLACTVFGSEFDSAGTEADARAIVAERGLSSLQQPWELRARCEDVWQPVSIRDASARRVHVTLGSRSRADAPSRSISVDELRTGEFELRLR